MVARAVAVVGVRIIALLIMLQGLFGAVIVASVMIRGVPPPSSSSTAATVLMPRSERVRDVAQAKAVIWSTVPSVAVHIAVALLLLFLSQPLGRVLARGIE